MKLVTAARMRELEALAVAAGATWPGLMEQAGWGVAQEALAALGDTHGRRALVLVGPGNNGGDGLVVARHLHDGGIVVALYVWRRSLADDDANWLACRARDIPTSHADDDPALETLRSLLMGRDLSVDALLGMGVARPLTGQLATIVGLVNLAHAAGEAGSVLAVDLPSGVDADSGQVHGVAIEADLTVATGMCKRGLYLWPGRGHAGRILLADIGIPATYMEETMSETIGVERARALLPTRPDDGHKGSFGKVMVVAGSLRYPGAALLASEAALRAGAGLVTLACGRSLYPVLAARVPEATMLPLPEADWGILGEEAGAEVAKSLEGYRALLLGPGLGQEEATGKLLSRLLGVGAPKKRASVGFKPLAGAAPAEPASEDRPALPPLVIDADGLNLLAKVERWWERLAGHAAVLTPHPGEMARLLGDQALGEDRAQAAADAAANWGQVVVLKGAGTVVAAPDGRLAIDEHGGNAALATAGTGDVLAGTIAGLLAQGLEPFEAAQLGVYLHSAAGALMRDELGTAGAAASDLLPRLPQAIRALR
jgi:ADP-dependent NAD(P)H-hydrate dehydratase / NAD(P)H-hydrate epimerase